MDGNTLYTEIYDYTEHKTNKKWWNGTKWKDVYRKVYHINSTSTDYGVVGHFDEWSIAEDIMFTYSGKTNASSSTENGYYGGFFTRRDEGGSPKFGVILLVNGDIVVNTRAYDAKNINIIFEYTKTAD